MATSNVTPDRDRTEVASRAPAVVIPLPGAAAAPVVQTRRRGRLPQAVANLRRVRVERSLKAWRNQVEDIRECRAELTALLDHIREHWAGVHCDLVALDRVAANGMGTAATGDVALELLRDVIAARREVFRDSWSWETVPFDQKPDWLDGLE